MKNLITIGLPSKGRLKEGSISFFEKNNLCFLFINYQPKYNNKHLQKKITNQYKTIVFLLILSIFFKSKINFNKQRQSFKMQKKFDHLIL